MTAVVKQSKPPAGYIDVDHPVCIECKSVDQVFEDERQGIMVCHNCGVQQGGQVIRDTQEWRTFGDGDNDGPRSHAPLVSRVGAREDGMYFAGLSTVMDSRAAPVHLARLQRQEAVGGADMAKLLGAGRVVDDMCSKFSLPDHVANVAKELLNSCVKDKSIKYSGQGKTRNAVVAASVYAACLVQSCSQLKLSDLEQLADSGSLNLRVSTMTHVSQALRKIRRSPVYKKYVRHAVTSRAAVAREEGVRIHIPPEVSTRVEECCSTLRLSRELQNSVHTVVQSVYRLGIVDGRTSHAVLGSVLAFVMGKQHLSNISLCTRASQPSIRELLRTLEQYRAQLLS